MGYHHLANKMIKDGLLSDVKLIFYLTHHEIQHVLKNTLQRSSLMSKAIRRRRFYSDWKSLQFHEFNWGIIKPIEKNDEKRSEYSEIVSGTPICGGNVTGRACVVRTFAEISKIKYGDILITHSTDIAWSPYFPILSGVVTELGGLISHGAVVAREYGLPAIVGATNATSVIIDGERIFMNAYTGIITKVIDGNKDDEVISET